MALTSWTAMAAALKNKAQNFLFWVKGEGEDEIYALEVDSATGRLPVDANVVFSQDTNWGVVGDDTLRVAAEVGNATGAAAFGTGTRSAQTLRVTVATDDVVPVSQSGSWTVAATQSGAWSVAQSGNWSTRTLDGAGTSIGSGYGSVAAGLRVAAQIGNASAVADFGSGAVSAQTLRITPATDVNGPVNLTQIGGAAVVQGYGAVTNALRVAAQIGNASSVADFGSGAVSSATLRVTPATDVNAPMNLAQLAGNTISSGVGATGTGTVRMVQASRTMADKGTKTVSGSNITSAAYNQIIASTAAAATIIDVSNTTGEPLIIATGGAGSEVDLFYVGESGCFQMPLAIAASTRISLKSLGSTATGGYVLINLIV